MKLQPLLEPVWVPLTPRVEVSAWYLRLTDGSLLLGISGEEAEAYAASVGGELVSAEEEDLCVSRAARVLTPITHDQEPPGPAAQSLLVMAQLQELGGCPEDGILASACKVWTRDKWMPGEGRPIEPGHSVTYGWHVPSSRTYWEGAYAYWRGMKTYPCGAEGYRVIQGRSDFHLKSDVARRYEQGVRVRRAAR